MSLRARLNKLEAHTPSDFQMLAQLLPEQLERWQEVILEHYAQDRLDALATRTDLPVGDILRNFAHHGAAVRFEGHWHPLFKGTDEFVNAHVYARVFELCEDDPRASAAFDAAAKLRLAA